MQPQVSSRLSAAPADLAAPGDALLQALWRQRRFVAAVTGACLVAAVGYLLVAPRVYLGAARVYVQPAGPRIMGDGKQQLVDTTSQNFLSTQRELIQSTPVLVQALTKLEGDNRPKVFDGAEDRFEYLKNHVGAKQGKNDDLLIVYCEAPNPKDAADIANAVVAGYMVYHAKQKESTASEVLKVLQSERQKTEGDLAAKTKEMLEFRRSRGVLSFSDEKGNVTLARLKSVSDALTAAQLDTFSAKSGYEEALKSIANDAAKIALLEDAERGGGTGLSAGEEGQLRLELLQWRAKLNTARQTYGEEHPNVRAIQKHVDALDVAYVAALGRRYEAAQQKEQELQTAYQAQQKDAIARSADAAEYQRLEVEIQRLDKHLDEVAKRIQEIQITETSLVSNITPVEWASPPRKPYRPKALYTLPVALVTGLLLGVVLACARDWHDPRLRSAEEVKAVLGVAVLGEIPRMEARSPGPERGRRVLLEPASDVAEACRGLRTAIYYGVREDGGKARTLLLTSPSPQDGKSTAASNLAIAMAQAGKRVLLVDADLRRPTQHQIFNLPPGAPGLADLLSRDDADLSAAVQRTDVENLDVLPCGPEPDHPAELLIGRRFVALLEKLTGTYDHVIIDSPPVGPVVDARIIAASCDAVILVLRADDINRRRSESARDALLGVGAKLMGAVLNGVEPDRDYHYGSYYRPSRGNDNRPGPGRKNGKVEHGNGRVELPGNARRPEPVATPAPMTTPAAPMTTAAASPPPGAALGDALGEALGQRRTRQMLLEAMAAAIRDGRMRLAQMRPPQRPRRG